jgi:hypothetical protein
MNSTFKQDLQFIANADVETLCVKNVEYGQSWKRRGGVGAFMMLARKWDRLETTVQKEHYDIFAAIIEDKRPEGILDDIRDLRCYLMLVELEMTNRPYVPHSQEHPFGYDPE